MRRFMFAAAAALALALLVAGTALAAKPVEGAWTGTKITEFAPGGCAAGPFPWTMKVAPNGSFKLKKKIGLEGGRPITMKITGKFTTPTSARGAISYGKCKQKFKATGKAPVPEQPVQPVQPDPTDG